jgi:hypothetical protein
MLKAMLLPGLLLSLAGLLPADAPGTHDDAALRWGADGHRMVGEAAARTLPPAMPAFFREAADQLSWLNPEPDRWRSRAERDLDAAMDRKYSPEHYVNFEGVPESAFRARDRYAYLDSLRAHGFDIPGPGLLPWTILELSQRLRVGFREWRAATDPRQREWIEQRILNDAGILGHYVADASNPAHTTIHHNGWVGENPRGYATDNRFHSRFESAFVRAQVRPEHVRAEMGSPVRVFPELRPAIWEYLRASNGHVVELYEHDLRSPFDEHNTDPANRRFAAQRLAFGAEMLRDLWWSAWVTSGEAPQATS